jgi:predicted enzyme related to lactoylglutathione lyase
MVIKRVALSWVGVGDIKKSKDFFVDILGLKIFEEQPEYGWLEVKGSEGGNILGIGRACEESGMKKGVNAVVTFVADDYEQAKKELAAKGVALFGEVEGCPGVPRMICFKDPDGNTFQLVEETEGHTGKI